MTAAKRELFNILVAWAVALGLLIGWFGWTAYRGAQKEPQTSTRPGE